MPRSKDSKGHKRSGSKSQPTSPLATREVRVPPSPSPGPSSSLVQEEDTPPVNDSWAVVQILKAIVTIGVLPFVSLAIQFVLQPLYGSTPALAHYRNISLGGAILSGVLTTPGEGSRFPDESALLTVLGLFLLASPGSYFLVAVATSRVGSALWGPVVTHVLLTAPIYCMFILLLRHYLVSGLEQTIWNDGLSSLLY